MTSEDNKKRCLCNEGESNENKAEVEIDDVKVDDCLLMQDNDLGLKEDDWNKMMIKSEDNDLVWKKIMMKEQF